MPKSPCKRINAVQKNTGRAGAGQGRGDFLADVARFADADDHDFAALPQRFDNDVDGRVKIAIKLLPDGFQRRPFDLEHLPRSPQMIHDGRVPAGRQVFNIDFCRQRINVTAGRGLRMKMISHVLLVFCFLAADTTAFAQTDSAVERVADSYNSFGLKLLAQIRQSVPGKNVFLSPSRTGLCPVHGRQRSAGRNLAANYWPLCRWRAARRI